MALLGGIVLSFLIILTCVSILGRLLNGVFNSDLLLQLAPGLSQTLLDAGLGPVNGDFELVQSGMAFAIFAFLPLCQITSSHASVDVLTRHFSSGVNRLLRLLTEIAFASVLILIAWRLYDGMTSKMRYNETTFLLQFPIWWAYAASLAGACVAAVTSVYVSGARAYELFSGHDVLGQGTEGEA
ncbi:MAG: TRAP transporter small permease [Pseudomonadota bacterium]